MEGRPGWMIKVAPRNSLLRKVKRVCWPMAVSTSPMIATALGLKIASSEPAFPNDALGQSLRSFGRRLASADILLALSSRSGERWARCVENVNRSRAAKPSQTLWIVAQHFNGWWAHGNSQLDICSDHE